jgi:hypothetical protein
MKKILTIDSSTRVKQVQAAFAELFPFLKLEFFKTPQNHQALSQKKEICLPNEPVFSWDGQQTAIEIMFENNMQVLELEAQFANNTGLSAQVFRRSGNVWIETSLTDDWTLEQQNNEGELLSTPLPIKSIEPKF